jgi:hypothetical protein
MAVDAVVFRQWRWVRKQIGESQADGRKDWFNRAPGKTMQNNTAVTSDFNPKGSAAAVVVGWAEGHPA